MIGSKRREYDADEQRVLAAWGEAGICRPRRRGQRATACPRGTGRPSASSVARDNKVEPNLAWKDTVLVRTGETVDILLDVTNPGLWMAHCHIAEHHESGMMFNFQVDPKP